MTWIAVVIPYACRVCAYASVPAQRAVTAAPRAPMCRLSALVLHAILRNHSEKAIASPRAARSEGKARGHKRPVQHDATLDYPQLG